MSDLEAALLGGFLGNLVFPAGILFHARYSVRGWNSRAILIHVEHDARVVGRRFRPSADHAPTGFRARGRVTI